MMVLIAVLLQDTNYLKLTNEELLVVRTVAIANLFEFS